MHDGTGSVQLGPVEHGQDSWLETTVQGPGMLTFWWKVSSEPSYDRLRLYLDGVEELRLSGEVEWELRTLSVPAGARVLRWRYSKNGSTSRGLDRGWLAQVRFTAATQR